MFLDGRLALAGLSTVLAVAAAAAPDDELARRVTSEEVSAAKASTPAEDASVVRNRLGAALGGRQGVLFADEPQRGADDERVAHARRLWRNRPCVHLTQ